MKVKQISVFIENRSGRLSEVAKILGKNGINIRALALAETTDYGILRLIVDKPDETLSILRKANFTLSETDVIAAEVSDSPGGLSRIVDILSDAEINIEYMYAFVEKSSNNAVLIFRIENIDKAIEALVANSVKLLTTEEIMGI